MLYSGAFSPILWDTIRKANGDEASLKRLLSQMERGDLELFFREFRKASVDLWNTGLPALLSDQSQDTVNEIFEFVVAQGAEYYDRILTHPEEVPRLVDSNDVWVGGVALLVFWERFQERPSPQDY